MNSYEFIKENMEFFDVAATHPDQFMKWIWIIGGPEAVNTINEANHAFADIFKNKKLTFCIFYSLHDASENESEFNNHLKKYFSTNLVDAINILDTYLPRLENLALKFKKNTGTAYDENLNYHAMTVRMEEIQQTTFDPVTKKHDKTSRLYALKKFRVQHQQLLKSFKKDNKFFITYGERFRENVLEYLNQRFNIIKDSDFEYFINKLLSIYQTHDLEYALRCFKKFIFVYNADIELADKLDGRLSPDNPLVLNMIFREAKYRPEDGFVIRYFPHLVFRKEALDLIAVTSEFIKACRDNQAHAACRLFSRTNHQVNPVIQPQELTQSPRSMRSDPG